MMGPRVAFHLLLGLACCLAWTSLAGAGDDGPSPAPPAAGTDRAGGPSAAAATPEMPPPPAGFRWHEHVPTRGYFLVPDGWFVKEVERDGVLALLITKERLVSESDEFQTGFTLNTFASPEFRRRDGAALGQEWMESHVANAMGAGLVRGVGKEPFSGNWFQVQVPGSRSPDGTAFNLTGIYLHNRSTGALHVMWFESPASDWESAWKVGGVIMDMFAVETEF